MLFTEENKKNRVQGAFSQLFRNFFDFLLPQRLFLFLIGTPFVDASSSLRQLFWHYPDAKQWFVQRFKISPTTLQQHVHLTLGELSHRWQLPPPQILFMEFQLDARMRMIQTVTPGEAKALIHQLPTLRILDFRDGWEQKMGELPRSEPANTESVTKLLHAEKKNHPILVYCHFGVRSLDFAIRFAEAGFKDVYFLQGGIDAWSQQVDATIPRYEGSWC